MRRHLVLYPLVLALAACGKSSSTPDAGPQEIVGAPSLASVSPALGAKAGGTVISVLGANLVDGARLFVGGSEATDVVWVSDRRVTARTTPSAVSGDVTVTIVNPDGQKGTLANGFRYIPPPSERTDIDSCQLVSPISDSVGAGQSSDSITGAVTAIGVTDFAGQGGKIAGQLGFGPGDQAVDSPFWTWIPASYNDSQSGSTHDGYSAQLVGPAIGQYKYAFRFNYNGGSWTYCDFDGSQNGFSMDEAGPLLVHGPTVTWCSTVDPVQLLSTQPGQPVTYLDGGVATIHAEAYLNNSTTDDGAHVPDYVAQVGYGPATDGVGADSWTWVDAAFDSLHAGQFGNNYRWAGTFNGPTVSGNYNFGYRISVSNGPWTYCGTTNPVDPTGTTGLGTLNAVGLPTIDFCLLESPPAGPTSITANVGDPTTPASSRAYKNGVTTDKSGASASQIASQFGYGPTDKGPADPSWTWTASTFNGANGGQFGNDYKYLGSTTAPAAGSYHFTFRYALNGGPWTYCDTNGISDGGSPTNLGTLTTTGAVGPPPSGPCKLESLDTGAITSGAPVTAVGRVTIAGVTDSAGQGAGLKVQAGVGATGGANIGWAPASYFADDGGSDMYIAQLAPAYTGTRLVEFRVSQDDGGTWSVCDSSQVPDAGALIVGNFAGSAADPGYCTIQFPTPSNGCTQTTPGFTAYGQVYAAGTTDATAFDGGAIEAQLGVGQGSEDPGVSANWTWYPADFNYGHGNGGNNFEYQAAFPDAGSGNFNFLFRYRLTGSTAPWCYGDQAPAGQTDGVAPGDLGAVTFP